MNPISLKIRRRSEPPINLKAELFTRVNGKITSGTDSASRSGLMARSTKAVGKRIKQMAKEPSTTSTVTFLKANGQTIKQMAPAHIYTKMVHAMKEVGRTTSRTGSGRKPGWTEVLFSGSINKASSMERESTPGLMEAITMALGPMAKYLAQEYIDGLTGDPMKVSY